MRRPSTKDRRLVARAGSGGAAAANDGGQVFDLTSVSGLKGVTSVTFYTDNGCNVQIVDLVAAVVPLPAGGLLVMGAFLLTLRDSGVRFLAVDMPETNDLAVGIMALVAQAERDAISRRTKEALAVASSVG